jgi:hypothetical protein
VLTSITDWFGFIGSLGNQILDSTGRGCMTLMLSLSFVEVLRKCGAQYHVTVLATHTLFL